MAGFGAKVKLSVDKSSKADFNNQINSMINQIKISNKFVVLQKDMAAVTKSIETAINQNPIKIKKIDCSAAVNDMRRQLQSMIDALSIKNGVTITGLKDPIGKGTMTSAMNQTVKSVEEAEAAVAKYNSQLKILQTTQQTLDAAFKSASSGSKMLKDTAQLKSIQAEYDALIQKIQGFKSASETERNAIIESARGLQEKITALQQEQSANEKAAAAAEKRTAAEERARAAEEKETANLKQYYTLLTQIQRAQDSWTKAKTGTTSGQYAQLETYSSELRTLFSQLQSGEKTVAEFNTGITEIGTRFAAASTQIRAAGENTKSLLDRFGTLGQKFTSWLTVSQVVMLVIRSIKQMVSSVIELNSALTQIEIVTGASGSTLERFAENAAAAAKAVGSSVTDIVKSTETYARLGYNLDQSLVLSEVTGKYANVAATTVDDATASLTSIMKAFNVAPEQMEGVVDMLVKVGQEYAVSAGELGEALQNGGAALEAGGNTIEESIALIAAGNAAVQDASAVGNALKTTSMRIRSSTAELEEMGETVDDLVKSASKYRAEIQALSGVDIMLDENTYKSTYQILKEIAGVWKDLSDIQQATLLEDLAGKRNANVVKSIITNLQDLEGAYQAASNASGTLADANATYMDSIEAKVKQFKASFQEFSSALFPADLLKSLVDAGTGLMNILTQLEKLHILLPAIVASLTMIKALRVAKSSAQSVAEIVSQYAAQKVVTEDLANSIRTLNAAERELLATKIEAMIASGALTAEEGGAIMITLGLAAAEETATVATEGLAVSFKSLMASIPIFGWIALGISVLIELIPTISRLTSEWGKTSDEVLNDLNSEFNDLQSSIQSVSDDFRNLKSSADEVIPRFAELSEGVDQFGNNLSLTQGEYEEFLNLNNRVAEMFPELNLGMDSNGNAMLALSGDADTLTESLYALVEVQRQAANQKIADTMPDLLSNMKDTDRQLNRQLDNINKQKEALTAAYQTLADLEDERITLSNTTNSNAWGEKKDLLESLGVKITTSNARSGIRDYSFDVSYEFDAEEAARNYENAMTGLEREINNINREISLNHAKVNPVISAWMQTDFNYQELSGDMQRAALAMVRNIDFYGMGLTTQEGIQEYISDNIIRTLQNASPEVQNAITNLLSLTPSAVKDLSMNGYFAEIDELAKKIADATGFTYEQVLQNTGFDAIVDQYGKMIDDLADILDRNADIIEIPDVPGEWAIIDTAQQFKDKLLELTPSELARAYSIVKDYGVKTWDELVDALENRTFEIVVDLDTETSGMENLTSAMKQSTEATGLTSEAIENLKARYADLEGFDAGRLFEKTANGIHLNTTALTELEATYEKQNKNSLDKKLGELVDQYNKLTDEIDGCTDASERLSLIAQRYNLADQINETATLAAQYEGLTSAYNKWLQAQSSGNERDMYETILSGRKSLEDAMSRGWLGDDEKAFIQLLSSADLSTASLDEYLAAYQRLKQEIGDTGYTVFDFFTQDESGNSTSDGVFNFFDAVRKELGETYAYIDENGGYHFDFGEGGDEDVAKKLGMNIEAVQAILRAAADAGFEINLDSWFSQFDFAKTSAEKAAQALKELGATDIDFDFNTSSLDKMTTQIEQAQELYDSLVNSDGTLKVGVDQGEADNAATVLGALIAQKQKLLAEDTVIMHVKVDKDSAHDGIEQTVYELQELQRAYNNLEIKVALHADTTDSQAKIQEVAQKISELPDDVKATLGLDTSEVDSAIESITGTEIDIEAGVNLDQTAIDTLLSAVTEITPEMLVTAGLDSSLIDNYEPDNKEATVKYDVNDSAVQRYRAPDKTGTVTYTAKLNDWTPPTKYGTVVYQAKNEGDSKAKGTAFASGNWGTRESGRALGGELGQELVVRDGKFFTIGDNGAEFFDYKKGDIIFNAEQTKQLLKTGKIRLGKNRGDSYAEGTAFSNGSGAGRGRISGAVTGNGTGTGNGTVDVTVSAGDSSLPANVSIDQAVGEVTDAIASDFESLYKYHQHLLKMAKETNYEYLTWLDKAYKEAYANGEIELDDYYKYEEEVFTGCQDILDDIIGDYEHMLAMGSRHGMGIDEIISIYRLMQDELHILAEHYRELGLDENSDYIQDLSEQWWEYQDAIKDAMQEAYDASIQDHEHDIELMDRNGASTTAMINVYRRMQEEAHDLAERYREMGLEENDDYIQDLSEQWWDFNDEIKELKERAVQDLLDIVDAVSELVDKFQNINDILHDAANEYAANGGFISVDTFQEIVEMGPQYLQFLKDENDQLVINDERINDIIAAKTQELALETALSYVERLRLAQNGQSLEDLNNLLYATEEAADATWGLVYANLGLLNLTDDQYDAALHNINALRALAENAIAGIGKTAGAVTDTLSDMKSGLDDILKYVMDMLKQRIKDQIDALKDMKDAYKDIINLRKEALKTAKDEASYQDKIAEKVQEIAKIQKRLRDLGRDDSRDAAVQQAKLEEDMAKLQKELADEQADYAREAQEDALDDMQSAYEEEKDYEIRILEDSISSYQKLYDMAISYISDHWDTLYSKLIDWNTQYGSVLNSEITSAWDNCLAAAQRYGSYVAALNSIDADINAAKGDTHNDNLGPAQYDNSHSDEEGIHAIIRRMYANSREWASADKDRRRELDADNLDLGARLSQYGVKAVRDNQAGVWYVDNIGGAKLYDKYRKYTYHNGGVAGDKPTLKQNEIVATLEDGEMILNKPKQKVMYQIIDFTSVLSEKLGKLIRSADLSGLFGGMKTDVADLQSKALGAVTNNQSERIHFGDITIYGANDDTVKQHQEINRKFTNDILKLVGIKR